MTPKLPLKFILLWIVNLAIIIALDLTLGLREILPLRSTKYFVTIYLVLGTVLALLEQALMDKLHGE